MNYWKNLCVRWEAEELKTWSSIGKTAYMLVPFFLYLLVHDAAEVTLWALTEVVLRYTGSGTLAFLQERGGTLQGILGGIAVLLALLVVWPAVKNEIGKLYLAEGRAERVTDYCFLMVLAFCLAVSVNIFFYQLGFTRNSEAYTKVYQAQYDVKFLIGVILYGIISPVAEEAVFRALIYNRMKRCFGLPVAIVISSVLFGIYHQNAVQAVYGTILGAVIACMYEMYGSFLAPVLFHTVANVSVYAMTYRGSMEGMEKKTALFSGGVLLLTAGLLFLYIRNKLEPQGKQEF